LFLYFLSREVVMTEDLISCSFQSSVGTNLCEARTKKSSVVE